MKQLFLMVVLAAITFSATAQTQRITKTVAGGSDLNTVLADERFLFDGFKESLVFFENSSITKAMMNYNLLSGEMMFINKAGDTLTLKPTANIATIVIEERFFKYISKHYYEVLASDTGDETALLIRRYIEQGTPVKYGAYGIASPTAAIDNQASMTFATSVDGSTGDVNVNTTTSNKAVSTDTEIRFQRKDVYMLAQGKKVRTADKKGFLKIFSKYKTAIESYLEQSSVDFKKEQDILRLYNYCVGL